MNDLDRALAITGRWDRDPIYIGYVSTSPVYSSNVQAIKYAFISDAHLRLNPTKIYEDWSVE